MKFVERIEKTFRFTSLFKPLVYLILFSLIYDAGYLWLSNSTEYFALAGTMWMAVYGLGVYFVCSLAWGKKRGTLEWKKIGIVLLWCLFWGVIVQLISILYLALYGNMAGMLLSYSISGAGLIFAVPLGVLLFRLLYNNVTQPHMILASISETLRRHFGKLINSWLVLLLVMIAWDSMFYGPLAANEMNVPMMFSNLVFYGAPFMFPVMIFMLSGGTLAAGMTELAILYILSGIFLCWLSLNMVCWSARFDLPENAPSQTGGKAEKKR